MLLVARIRWLLQYFVTICDEFEWLWALLIITDKEETHIRDYSDAEIEEIVAKLRELSDLAPSYHIGGMVFGLPANSVQSLLETAAKRLEESKWANEDGWLAWARRHDYMELKM